MSTHKHMGVLLCVALLIPILATKGIYSFLGHNLLQPLKLCFLHLPFISLLFHLNASRIMEQDCGAFAAHCVVLCCCCECFMLQFFLSVFFKIPQKLAHKMRKFVIRRKKRRDMKTFLPTKEEEHLSGDESRVSCMEGIEEMLQELSMEGEFVFGSFWRQGDSTNDLDSRNSQYNDHSLSCSSHKM
ncbi:unnamed protein product [Brassica oleracea var. botrytis]